MSDELERYELVHNPSTQEPIGVTDLWQPGAQPVQDWPPQQPAPVPAYGQVYQPVPVHVQVPMPAYQPARMRVPGEFRVRLYLYAAAVIFAAGMAVSAWFFGSQKSPAPAVVVCPAPGVQVAARPAECGPPQGVAP